MLMMLMRHDADIARVYARYAADDAIERADEILFMILLISAYAADVDADAA